MHSDSEVRNRKSEVGLETTGKPVAVAMAGS